MEQNRNKRYSDEGRWDQEQDRNRRQSERWQEDDNDQWGNAGSLGSYGREQSGSGYGSTYGNQGYKQGNQKRWQEDDRMQNIPVNNAATKPLKCNCLGCWESRIPENDL